MIPWDEIEQRYAKFFANRKGNGAKPLRLALGASFAPNSTGAFDLPLTIGLSHGWLTLTILSDTLWVWLSYMYFCWSYNFFTVSSFALSCLGKLSVFIGKFSKDEIRDKKQDYIDKSERVEVERKFSLAKSKCGIGLIVTRLKETTCHCLAMSVLLLNLRKIGKVLFTIFSLWFQKLLEIYNASKMAIIQ